MYKDFKDLVDFHYTYVSLNNKFLEELGLIESSESYGKYVPTKKAIEFQKYKKWNRDNNALDILRELVTESWFWNSTKQILLMREDGAGHDVIAVLDDKPARKGAQALSIPVTGTLGMVFHAVQLGTITPEFGIATVDELISVGAGLDAMLVRKIIDKMSYI